MAAAGGRVGEVEGEFPPSGAEGDKGQGRHAAAYAIGFSCILRVAGEPGQYELRDIELSENLQAPVARAPSDTRADKIRSARTMAAVVYALQAFSFLLGITFVIGVIISYVKRGDVRGSWLESHFRWQIRTFWFSLLWSVIGIVTSYVLVGYFILVAALVWLIYRIVKGWLRLVDNEAMYPPDRPTHD